MDTIKLTPLAREVMQKRYLARNYRGEIIETPDDLFARVAWVVAEADRLFDAHAAVGETAARFEAAMTSLAFLPNSPCLMNAGRPLGQLAACFVLPVEDNLESIFQSLKDAALIHRTGGGTGFSFGRLRPAGDTIFPASGVTGGPVSFIRLFDSATHLIDKNRVRPGANMGVLPVSHPDIEAFITAKRDRCLLRNFNLSVAVDDLTDCTTTGSVLVNSTNPKGWVHLAVTVNTKTNLTTWYVNGVLNNSAAANITGKGTSLVCFGDSGSSSGYQGNDDDFRIYNWARTAADIASDYTRNAIGTGPSGSPNVPDLGYYECELPIQLVASGSPRPGGTVAFSLSASSSAGLPYQLGSSLGIGPTPLGTRSLGLSLDDLLVVTVGGFLPSVFVNYAGTLDGSGNAGASVVIPSIPALIGIRIHSAFVTLSAASPFGIKEISSTESFAITS